MKLSNKHLTVAGGVLLAGVVVVGASILADRPPDDRAPNTRIAGSSPSARNDQMTAVSPDDAARRATANQAAADQARVQGRTYVAPAVIMERGGPEKGEAPPPVLSTQQEAGAPPPASRPPAAPAQPTQQAVQQAPPQIVYAYQQPVQDGGMRERVMSQFDALSKTPSGGFAVRTYGSPAKADDGAAAGNGATGRQAIAAVAASAILAARPGDQAYAVLDRGFNSADPQAYIFATIFDNRDGGNTGPLHGSRVLGQITYNREQAALTFSSLIMPSGYQVNIKAFGINEQDGRTGIAQSVDNHTLERYSGLLVAGLIQGAGQVGQQLISNNQTYTYTSTGAIVSQSQPSTLLQAGMAAMQPVGQAMSSAAAGQFNRPATISSPAQSGIGVVFLDALQIPLEQVQRSQAIVRAGMR